MKLVRNLAAALFLACALTVNAFAGDQQTPGYVEPPTQPPPAVSLPSSSTDKADAPPAIDGKVTIEKTTAEELLVSAIYALLSVF